MRPLLLIIELLTWITVAVVLLPVLFFSLECIIASIAPLPSRKDEEQFNGSIAVLIPAHNEEAVLSATLKSILPQLRPQDVLLVVADNCTDHTAEIARSHGGLAIERTDTANRGKGFALDFGVRFLQEKKADVLIIMDADCIAEPGSIQSLAIASAHHQRPIQAVYLMETPINPSPADRISAFAFRVKNLVRPFALRLLRMPCLLTGTGMAFPWNIIKDAPLASANIVEDMQLGLDLAIHGHAPLLCPNARVIGQLPAQNAAAISQRTRWEHGHMHTIKTQIPRLFFKSIKQFRLSLFFLTLELLVPPLSLLTFVWSLVSFSTIVISLYCHWFILTTIAVAAWPIFIIAVLLAWIRFAREILPASTLLSIPAYICQKLPLYKSFFGNRQTSWIRTSRT